MMNTNFEFYDNLFDKTEEYLEQSMKTMIQCSGISLTQIDPSWVEMWNSTIGYLDGVKDETLNWAKAQDRHMAEQDELLKKLKEQNQIIIGMLTKKQDD